MRTRGRISTKDMTVFAMLGTLMLVSKLLLEWAPNIHLVGMLTVTYTVVYRVKALIPIYVYVFMLGLYYGFDLWWIPYLYIWTVLWAASMLIPANINDKAAVIVYPIVCALHGLLFGTLYAPAQAIIFGLDFKGMLSWIAVGFPWDLIHAAGNFAAGFLILPCTKLIRKLDHGQTGGQ